MNTDVNWDEAQGEDERVSDEKLSVESGGTRTTHERKCTKHQHPTVKSPKRPIGRRLPVRRPPELAIQLVRSPVAPKVEAGSTRT